MITVYYTLTQGQKESIYDNEKSCIRFNAIIVKSIKIVVNIKTHNNVFHPNAVTQYSLKLKHSSLLCLFNKASYFLENNTLILHPLNIFLNLYVLAPSSGKYIKLHQLQFSCFYMKIH